MEQRHTKRDAMAFRGCGHRGAKLRDRSPWFEQYTAFVANEHQICTKKVNTSNQPRFRTRSGRSHAIFRYYCCNRRKSSRASSPAREGTSRLPAV